MNKTEFGYVLIYLAAFGISDYFVKKINNDLLSMIYYILLGTIGVLIIFN
jgi:hypothetical protein